jgi:hypothetical protein
MDERQKIDWAQQDKKLLLLLEKQQALPTNHPFSMAKLDEEIMAVEELVRSYKSAARQRTPLAIRLRPAPARAKLRSTPPSGRSNRPLRCRCNRYGVD